MSKHQERALEPHVLVLDSQQSYKRPDEDVLIQFAREKCHPTYFYPTDSAPLLSQVNSGRRMPEWVELDARTTRPLGDNQAQGNQVLISY